MSKQYKCPHCGFIGYPEIARREKKRKFILAWLFDDLLSPRDEPPWYNSDLGNLTNYLSVPKNNIFSVWLNSLRPSYYEWDNFSAEKHLRCAKCKQPLFIDKFEEQPLPPIHREE